MGRTFVVAFMSAYCTIRLVYDSEEEAKAAARELPRTRFGSLIGVTAQYEGVRLVPKRKRRRRFPLRTAMALEPVPIIALFDHEFLGHGAMRRREP